MPSFYAILGVSTHANTDEIKKAYRRLAMQYHPDKTGGDDTHFKTIREAYETLSNPDKRYFYNKSIAHEIQAFKEGVYYQQQTFEALFRQQERIKRYQEVVAQIKAQREAESREDLWFKLMTLATFILVIGVFLLALK